MRADALGFFWRDEPPVKKVKAESVKRTPPERVWESPDYLPHYEEALAYCPNLFTDSELIAAAQAGVELEYDIECYPNYFLIAFTHRQTGKVIYFEMFEDEPMHLKKLYWVLTNFTLVGFNNKNYDETMATLAVNGTCNADLCAASNELIVGGLPGYEVLKRMRTKKIKEADQIDLIEVAPSFCSLKLYAGRMHSERMQDLPFAPNTYLNRAQVVVLRWYCCLDLTHTSELRTYLTKQIDLRIALGREYGIDLRSKSDAQIAEAVISAEMQATTGQRPQKTQIQPGTVYYYEPPAFLRYNTDAMNWVLNTVRQTQFVINDKGRIGLPEHISKLKIPLGEMKYQMGIGGLHSTEKRAAHVADDELLIIDRDVESYYPRIMIVLGLYPPHLGPAFLQAFIRIVDRRLNAKHAGDKVTADALKITVNGTYGKLGSQYSFLYAPHQIIQVTLTGQLALLMLIERLHLAGFQVVSANTDGIVTLCKKQRYAEFEAIFKQWELDTGFKTEETRYKALYSRDVNNYIALKEKGGYKAKGVYANPWDPTPGVEDKNEQLKHNPSNLICLEAVLAQLLDGVPVAKTIRQCKDVRKFLSVRNVSGGAVKVWEKKPLPEHANKEELALLAGFVDVGEGRWALGDDVVLPIDDAYVAAKDVLAPPTRIEYLGKAIRWYYAKGEPGELISAKTGYKVPKTDGAVPMMNITGDFPSDIDYGWYEREAETILKVIGYSQ